MMICKADFEELFPDLFQPEPAPATHQTAKPPSTACIARWEDDGGLPLPANRRRATSGRSPHYGFDVPKLARAGSVAAMLPAATAYAATWAMLSAYGR